MLRGRQLLLILGFWGVVAVVPAPGAAGGEIRGNSSDDKFYFGVMGQVARPGVYASKTPYIQLKDLIGHAGGLTTNATNQIRIVRRGNAGQLAYWPPPRDFPLVAGDIIVADGSTPTRFPERSWKTAFPERAVQRAGMEHISPEEFTASHQHVALVNLLNRPVILPVPASHANVPAILHYLGQDALIAGKVKVVPAGPLQFHYDDDKSVSSSFTVPTVLYFNTGNVRTTPLPEFPAVYEIDRLAHTPQAEPQELTKVVPDPPAETQTIIMPPAPEPVEAAEPELISEIRDLESQIPTPIAAPVPEGTPEADSQEDTPRVALVPSVAPAKTGEEGTGRKSWWVYLGLLLVLVSTAGFFANSRRRSTGVTAADSQFFHEDRAHRRGVASTPNDSSLESAQKSEPASKPDLSPFAQAVLNDEVLAKLVRNQLPVCEKSLSPSEQPAVEAPPKSRKVFRIDPPENPQPGSVTGPYIVKRPQSAFPIRPKPESEPKPIIREKPVAIVQTKAPQTEPEANEPASLLDRVLKQISQKPAA